MSTPGSQVQFIGKEDRLVIIIHLLVVQKKNTFDIHMQNKKNNLSFWFTIFFHYVLYVRIELQRATKLACSTITMGYSTASDFCQDNQRGRWTNQ